MCSPVSLHGWHVPPTRCCWRRGLRPNVVRPALISIGSLPARRSCFQGNAGHFAVGNSAMLARLNLDDGADGLDEHGTLRGAANTRAAWRVPAQFASEIGWERVFGAAARAAHLRRVSRQSMPSKVRIVLVIRR